MTAHDAEIHTLTETLIYELTKAFALPQTKWAKGIVRAVFGKAARATAELGFELDRAVAEGGLVHGARWLLPRFVNSHEARGVENIPATGPLVIVPNHPGSLDSILVSAHVNRADYKAIIGDIPFFEHLPNVSKNAFYTPDPGNATGRMLVVRDSIRHLNHGGSLLIFPRGGIEADPEFMPHPDDEFHHWSRSLEIFLHHVPGLQIIITIVSGVISQSAFRHPFTRFRKARPDRQRIAFMMQLARQILSGKEIYGLMPRVTFGEVIKGDNHARLPAEIEEAARRTLSQHMAWKHV
jgi:1-acyl-sn-glycerol-3-phosphate acyltransferase